MSESPIDVLGVGINSVDRVAVLPAFPQPFGPDSKLRISHYRKSCGGQTATALAACARLGLRAKYIGAVGQDADGAMVRRELAAAGVDASGIVAREAVTRFAVVLVDAVSGGRAVLWDFDERLKLTDDDVPAEALRAARLVHVDDVDVRAAIRVARLARQYDVPVTSDIDRVMADTRELVDAVSVAVFAEHVPGALVTLSGLTPRPADKGAGSGVRGAHSGAAAAGSGATSARTIRDALSHLPRRSDQTFVVTLGDRGALALDNDGFHQQPAFRVRAIDTTGAGDVFRAGFIYAKLRGATLDDQLRFANAAAAASCTRMGAMASVPTLEEVEEMLQRR